MERPMHPLIPPGFPADAIDTIDGCQVAADWWEEQGNAMHAWALRPVLCVGGPQDGQLVHNASEVLGDSWPRYVKMRQWDSWRDIGSGKLPMLLYVWKS